MEQGTKPGVMDETQECGSLSPQAEDLMVCTGSAKLIAVCDRESSDLFSLDYPEAMHHERSSSAIEMSVSEPRVLHASPGPRILPQICACGKSIEISELRSKSSAASGETSSPASGNNSRYYNKCRHRPTPFWRFVTVVTFSAMGFLFSRARFRLRCRNPIPKIRERPPLPEIRTFKGPRVVQDFVRLGEACVAIIAPWAVGLLFEEREWEIMEWRREALAQRNRGKREAIERGGECREQGGRMDVEKDQ